MLVHCVFLRRNRKVIVEKPSTSALARGDLELLCGRDILSNEQVNIASVRRVEFSDTHHSLALILPQGARLA